MNASSDLIKCLTEESVALPGAVVIQVQDPPDQHSAWCHNMHRRFPWDTFCVINGTWMLGIDPKSLKLYI